MTEEFLNESEAFFVETSNGREEHKSPPENSKSKKAVVAPSRRGRAPAATRKPATIRPARKNPVTPKPRKSEIIFMLLGSPLTLS